MSVDYRLLQRFRASQRRELAARGRLPVEPRPVFQLHDVGDGLGRPGYEGQGYEGQGYEDQGYEEGSREDAVTRPLGRRLTYLVSEDR